MATLLLDLLGVVLTALSVVALCWMLMLALGLLIEALCDAWCAHRDRKRAAVERELDRAEAELQAAIYEVARALHEDARKAEAAMKRVAASRGEGDRDV